MFDLLFQVDVTLIEVASGFRDEFRPDSRRRGLVRRTDDRPDVKKTKTLLKFSQETGGEVSITSSFGYKAEWNGMVLGDGWVVYGAD